MRPDGRNLTPMRALRLLRELDEYFHEIGTNGWIRGKVADVRDALADHVRYGLARSHRRKKRKEGSR